MKKISFLFGFCVLIDCLFMSAAAGADVTIKQTWVRGFGGYGDYTAAARSHTYCREHLETLKKYLSYSEDESFILKDHPWTIYSLGKSSSFSVAPYRLCSVVNSLPPNQLMKRRECVPHLSGRGSYENENGRCFVGNSPSQTKISGSLSGWAQNASIINFWDMLPKTTSPAKLLTYHSVMFDFFDPLSSETLASVSTPYGSMVSLHSLSSSTRPRLDDGSPPSTLSPFFASFFLFGKMSSIPKCVILPIITDVNFNLQRSLLHMSPSDYAPAYCGMSELRTMLYDKPQQETLSKADGWGEKFILGSLCDGLSCEGNLPAKYKNYFKTTIDFIGNAKWCTPVTAGKKGARRCKELPSNVLDLLRYKSDVAANVFPPKDIDNAENLWLFRAYIALGLANFKTLRSDLVEWLKDDISYDPGVLKPTTQACDSCLGNVVNQKHYLIHNVRRLLWKDEEAHDIVAVKTQKLKYYRYLMLTDRLIGALVSIGSDDKGKEFISGELKNVKKMDDLPLQYTCNKDDCSGLAIDVVKSLHDLAVYVKKLPKSTTVGIGPVVHSNPALVPGKPNHYADWKDVVECGSKIDHGCTKERYETFQKRVQRPNMMYVGANDGHLYAFNTDKAEKSLLEKTVFMYVPEGVIPYLSWLAQPMDLSQSQHYYVDGSPTVQDSYFDGKWHSVLAGGLRAGGQSVYALDITDPESFTKNNVLWEFTDFDDEDVGFVFARPAINKMNNGDWTVIFGNGFNSEVSDPVRTDCDGCSDPVGSGNGALFIVPLNDKTKYKKLDTNVAGGLGGVAPIDLNNDGRVDIIYAGDFYGRMWKFDVNSENDWKLGNGGKPIFAGKPHQTIFARPSVSAHPENKPGVVLYFGTGRRFAESDYRLRDQAIYGVWDQCGMVSDCSIDTIKEVNLQLVPSSDTPADDVDWKSKKGWWRGLESNQVALVPPVLRIGRLFIRTEPKNINHATLGDYNVMVFNAANGGPLEGLPLKVSRPTDKLLSAKEAFKNEPKARKGNTKWWFLPATVPTPGEQEMVIYEKGEDGTFIVAGDTIFTLNPFHQELGGRSWQSWRRTGSGICR